MSSDLLPGIIPEAREKSFGVLFKVAYFFCSRRNVGGRDDANETRARGGFVSAGSGKRNGLLFHCRFSALRSPDVAAAVSEGLPWDGR